MSWIISRDMSAVKSETPQSSGWICSAVKPSTRLQCLGGNVFPALKEVGWHSCRQMVPAR